LCVKDKQLAREHGHICRYAQNPCLILGTGCGLHRPPNAVDREDLRLLQGGQQKAPVEALRAYGEVGGHEKVAGAKHEGSLIYIEEPLVEERDLLRVPAESARYVGRAARSA